MKQRINHNTISLLISTQGTSLDSRENIEKELNSYFENLLTNHVADKTKAISKITRHIPQLITAEQNFNLLKPITM